MLPTSAFGVEREVVGVIGDQVPHLLLGEEERLLRPRCQGERAPDRIPPSKVSSRPWKRGGRFSRKAAIPSSPSAVLAARARRSPPTLWPASKAALASWTATGAFAAISSPNARQRSRKVSPGTASFTSPHRSAVAASMRAPEKIICLARARRMRSTGGGSPPILVGSRSSSLAWRSSPVPGRDAPIARQSQLEAAAERVPLTAAIVGWRRLANRCRTRCPSRTPGPPHVQGASSDQALTSAPTLKARSPAPVKIDGSYFQVAVDCFQVTLELRQQIRTNGVELCRAVDGDRHQMLFAAEPLSCRSPPARRHPPSRFPYPRASHEPARRPKGQCPKGQRRIDAGARRENGAGEDIEPRRVMDLQTTVDDTQLRIMPNAAPPRSCELPAPVKRGPCQVLVAPIARRISSPCPAMKSKPAAARSVASRRSPGSPAGQVRRGRDERIDIEIVALVRERLRLHADHAPVLPIAQVLLVALAPPPGRPAAGVSRLIWMGRNWFSAPSVAPPRKPCAPQSNDASRKSSRTTACAAGRHAG